MKIVLSALIIILCSAGCAPQRSATRTTSKHVETSVRPGINTEYLRADLEVTNWVERFEREGREIFTQRQEIVAAIGLKRGMSVADIGAGTGLFTPMLAEEVGPRGHVYAVDIVPKFLDHIERRARHAGLINVKTILGTERQTGLPANSIDLAFICDVYHHFEYPTSSLHSIRQALRKEGELFIVEFKRIPGTSSDWTLNHVRTGQEEVTREIEAAGFKKVEEIDLLKENYILRFRKEGRK
jgi:predicted methyltransferase